MLGGWLGGGTPVVPPCSRSPAAQVPPPRLSRASIPSSRLLHLPQARATQPRHPAPHAPDSPPSSSLEYKALADKKWRYVLETMAKPDWNPVAISAEAGHEVRTPRDQIL